MQYADTIVKNYLQYAQRNSSSQTLFSSYEDPTYLGFYFKISTTSTKSTSAFEDYAYDYYTDGLFKPADDPNSAIYYLKSRGEGKRAEMLTEFVKQFIYLTENMPWFLTSVAGLGEIWKFDPKTNYRGKDKKITFETLESIDLKITYLLDLYRKATFDTVYMRYMLPENLRFFNCELVVAEIRNIQVVNGIAKTGQPIDETLTRRYSDRTLDNAAAALGIQGITGSEIKTAFSGGDGAKAAWNDAKTSLKDKLIGSPSSDDMDYPLTLSDFNEMATFLTFQLGGCEFSVYDEAPKFLDSLKNTAETMAANSFSIKINYVKETNSYGLLGAIIKDTTYHQQRYSESNEMSINDGKYPTSTTAGDAQVLTKRERAASDTAQAARQKEIKSALTKSLSGQLGIGGALGNVIDGVSARAAGEATEVAGNLIGQSPLGQITGQNLGNVYENSTATLLASLSGANLVQTALNLISKATSPQLANSLLDKVTLSSPLINNNVSPAKVESSPGTFSSVGIDPSIHLTGNPGATSGDTDGGGNATFVISGTNPSVNLVGNPGSVVLMGPSTSSATPGNIDLIAPPTNSSISPNVTLEDSGATIDGNPGSTQLTGIGSLDGNPGSVELQGSANLEGNPGSVELRGKGGLEGNPGSVELQGSANLEGNPGTVPLTGEGGLEGSTGTVPLTGEGSLEGAPGKTILEGVNIKLEGVTGTTKLTGDANLEGNPGSVQLEGKGTFEGNPGLVELSGEGKLEGKPGKTDLTGEGKLEGSLSTVPLEGKGSLEGETGKTELEAPLVPNSKLTSVNLEGEGKLEGVPGKTVLTSPETQLEGYLGKTQLEGNANLIERNIGTTSLEGEARLQGSPGKVSQDGPENDRESSLGKTQLEAPKINNDMPLTEELIAPIVPRAQQGLNVNFEGPTIQLEANNGNAELTAPPSNLVSDNLGNSNPEQKTKI